MKHRHKFKILASSVKSVFERCSCGEKRERETTSVEKKRIKSRLREMDKQAKEMHSIKHDFEKIFHPTLIINKQKRPKNYKKLSLKKKMKYALPKTKTFWKWTGYELMNRVAKWAKKHPSVLFARCDDSLFASSDLVFIPHETKDDYMGSSVVYIPQCTGEEPISFFLYPRQAETLINALAQLKEKAKKKKK